MWWSCKKKEVYRDEGDTGDEKEERAGTAKRTTNLTEETKRTDICISF
jgi:hypothetical protein